MFLYLFSLWWHPGACIMKWTEAKIIVDLKIIQNPYLLTDMTESIVRSLSALSIRSLPWKISLWHHWGIFPSISFCYSSLCLFLSVSVLGGERVKGGILGRRRCRWSPVMECWHAFSSHSSFEWTVHLGPAGLPPCVGQHVWGFGCLFLASFLLWEVKNKSSKSRAWHCSY